MAVMKIHVYANYDNDIIQYYQNYVDAHFIVFSISIYFHISQVNLHITEIGYNKIITSFERTSQNNILNTIYKWSV